MTISGSPPPFARRHQLIINETGEHFIVYDERSHHIHQLNATSAAVWRHCDGRQSMADLQRLVSLDLGESVPMAAISLGLKQLSDADLLMTPWVAEASPRQSRRSLLRKAAITGTIAAPTLISISAPQAAAALSCPSGQTECLGTCCASGQTCTPFGCCLPGQICGQACCSQGQACAGGQCCAPERACFFGCCAEGLTCLGGGTVCCTAERLCGTNCCAPGQTCGSDGVFQRCV